MTRAQSDALAATLRDIRIDAGLTQKELARRCGIGEKTISTFETGWRTAAIRFDALFVIVSVCGCTLPDFFVRAELNGGRI